MSAYLQYYEECENETFVTMPKNKETGIMYGKWRVAADWACRVTVHVLLLAACINVMHVSKQVSKATIRYEYHDIQDVGHQFGVIPVTKARGTASPATLKKVNMFDECRTGNHLIPSDHYQDRFVPRMEDTVHQTSMAAVYLLSIQAGVVLFSYIYRLVVKGNYSYEEGQHTVLTGVLSVGAIACAVMATLSISMFLMTIQTKDECGLGVQVEGQTAINEFSPQAVFGAEVDVASTCVDITTKIIANEPIASSAPASRNMNYTDFGQTSEYTFPLTAQDKPSAAKLATYILNCDGTTNFPFEAESKELKRTLRELRRHSRSVVYLSSFGLILLGFHLMGVGTILRKSSSLQKVFVQLHNVFMSISTFAWYSVAMGSFFLYMAGREDHTSRENDQGAWYSCPMRNATFDGFDPKHDEKKFEDYHYASFILSFVVIVLLWIMIFLFRNTLAFTLSDKRKGEVWRTYLHSAVNMEMGPMLFSIVVGITMSLALFFTFYSSATQASTLCTTVSYEELSRQASGYILSTVGLGILVFTALVYVHFGFTGLIRSGAVAAYVAGHSGYETIPASLTMKQISDAYGSTKITNFALGSNMVHLLGDELSSIH